MLRALIAGGLAAMAIVAFNSRCHSDLPLNFHPAATRAPAVLNTPLGAV